jgi:hypothetical protein
VSLLRLGDSPVLCPKWVVFEPFLAKFAESPEDELRRTPLLRSSRGSLIYPIAPVRRAYHRRGHNTLGR